MNLARSSLLKGMTTLNASGFFLLGIGLFFAPAFFPDYFAVKALDGSSTSALWLAVMGLFQSALGVTYFIRNTAIPLAIKLATLRLPTFETSTRAVPGFILRPLRDSYLSLESNSNDTNEQRLAA